MLSNGILQILAINLKTTNIAQIFAVVVISGNNESTRNKQQSHYVNAERSFQHDNQAI